MAYQTDTASDHADFYDKLISFLTTDSDLVATGQAWEVVWESPSDGTNETDIVLKGPGLADTDNIFIGLRRVDNVPEDTSAVSIYGMTGIVSSALSVDEHINVSTNPVRFFLKTTPMDYWFVASGRRFMGCAQVGTVYESFYAGFFLPYGNPIQYNYPLYIGGMTGLSGNLVVDDWRDTGEAHNAFMYSTYDSTNGSNKHSPSAYLLSPEGDWLAIGTDKTSTGSEQPPATSGPRSFGFGDGLGADLEPLVTPGNWGYKDILERMGQTLGSGFCLTPITLIKAENGSQNYGVLDGVYHVPGRGQSIENIIGAGNYTHVVFQNAFRTDLGDWFAMQLYAEDSNSGLAEESNSQ